MAHDKRSSLRRILTARAAILGAWLAIAAVSAVVLAVVAATHPAEQTGRPAGATPTRAERLIALHHCWTGQAPTDVSIPGHVVVTLPHHHVASYGGPRAVRLALDHVFAGKHPHLTVHAFCR